MGRRRLESWGGGSMHPSKTRTNEWWASLHNNIDRRISPTGGGYPKPAFTEFASAE